MKLLPSSHPITATPHYFPIQVMPDPPLARCDLVSGHCPEVTMDNNSYWCWLPGRQGRGSGVQGSDHRDGWANQGTHTNNWDRCFLMYKTKLNLTFFSSISRCTLVFTESHQTSNLISSSWFVNLLWCALVPLTARDTEMTIHLAFSCYLERPGVSVKWARYDGQTRHRQ